MILNSIENDKDAKALFLFRMVLELIASAPQDINASSLIAAAKKALELHPR